MVRHDLFHIHYVRSLSPHLGSIQHTGSMKIETQTNHECRGSTFISTFETTSGSSGFSTALHGPQKKQTMLNIRPHEIVVRQNAEMQARPHVDVQLFFWSFQLGQHPVISKQTQNPKKYNMDQHGNVFQPNRTKTRSGSQ